ncbi:hypothetical protein BZG36_01194 [Bifiguratus adelaidae]|uniref:Endoplasmic oxidoreductin-1 n=1 Tax=Bifiguratus adelaidae TaxID=1938954 RepID=A0A261Y5M2_9FUNG|nr:hypothetical protein BZG36_01194 [Bifiguratus adelaidae]
MEDVLELKDQDYCKAIIPGLYDLVRLTFEEANARLFPQVQQLMQTDFFKYYRTKLWKNCPFWQENGLCMNRACAVEVADESDLPVEWRTESLSAIDLTPAGPLQPFKQCDFKESDYCINDQLGHSDIDTVTVDLLRNPERFTGYAGPSSGRVWKSIYEENCFNIVAKMTAGCAACNNIAGLSEDTRGQCYDAKAKITHHDREKDAGRHKLEDEFANVAAGIDDDAQDTTQHFVKAPKSSELDGVLRNLAEDEDGQDSEEETCLEKRVYYRLISGLHSSISIHICDEYFDRTKGVWYSNLDCFITRIGSHPERLQNVYFNYVVLLRAIAKVSPFLEGYRFNTGQPKVDAKVKAKVHELIDMTKQYPTTFDETRLFHGPNASRVKQEFKDHFRNVSRIMDCVGCEKCRLWGKVQTNGLAVALKILFEYETIRAAPKTLLERNEIVALFNTFNRFSESLNGIARFRDMYQQQNRNTLPPLTPPLLQSIHLADRLTFSAFSSRVSNFSKQRLGIVDRRMGGLLSRGLDSAVTQLRRSHVPIPAILQGWGH